MTRGVTIVHEIVSHTAGERLVLRPLKPTPLTQLTRRIISLFCISEYRMRARLLKPVVAVRQDVPAIVETLHEGRTVEFNLSNGVTEVKCDGKVYSAMLDDLLDAAHPIEWASASS